VADPPQAASRMDITTGKLTNNNLRILILFSENLFDNVDHQH
jgi:hypothetical protein